MFFAPFLFLYVVAFFVLLVFLFVLVEIHIISYAFASLGLPPEMAFLALLAALIGSYINIPVARIEGGSAHDVELVRHFGMRYRVPTRYAGRTTTIAVNVGGAVVPVLISFYILSVHPALVGPAALSAMIVAVLVHRFARPVPGLGIATPMFIPPIMAALMGYLFSTAYAHGAAPIAFVAGVFGTLVGADLWNLRKIRDLGAPVASIGGAGTFDGIFLTGIVAVLLS